MARSRPTGTRPDRALDEPVRLVAWFGDPTHSQVRPSRFVALAAASVGIRQQHLVQVTRPRHTARCCTTCSRDVIEAVVDYKTAAAKLSQRNPTFFAKLKIPLLRLFAGGKFRRPRWRPSWRVCGPPTEVGAGAGQGGKALAAMKRVGGALGKGAKALAPGIAGALVCPGWARDRGEPAQRAGHTRADRRRTAVAHPGGAGDQPRAGLGAPQRDPGSSPRRGSSGCGSSCVSSSPPRTSLPRRRGPSPYA